MLKCTFSNVSERDMDLLFLEEFVCSQDFLNIFLSKISLFNAKICSVEHSKVDVELGESDLTIIVEKDGKRYGLLIEDKIDAIAMGNQSGRYLKRGEIGIENGDYVDYHVFIVAPEKYLEVNEEAKKYKNKVTYEECIEYFNSRLDNRSTFKIQQIKQAIDKQKHGYQVIKNTVVTNFWYQYADFLTKNYPKFIFNSEITEKGAKSTWPTFYTFDSRIKIVHKSEKGYVDLEFAGLGNKTVDLRELIAHKIGKLWDNDLFVVQTGKSAVLRIMVPIIDFKIDFARQENKIDIVFSKVEKLYSILDDIFDYNLLRLFENQKTL